MIFEISFVLVGGVNFGLERSWPIVQNLLERYPGATWRRIINWRKRKGKYIVEV